MTEAKSKKTSRVPKRVPNPEYKPVGYRQIGVPKYKSMDKVAKEMLNAAGSIFDISSNLDTVVRDNVAKGLANIVHAAYDSQGCSLYLHDDAFRGFVRSSTEEWFRSRGFAEWFCEGAGGLFTTSHRWFRKVRIVTPRKARKLADLVK